MKPLTEAELAELSARTLAHYEHAAEAFWQGTRDHDVSQNVETLLSALPRPGCRILDLGCGPGRDLVSFMQRGHTPVGVDGCAAFVAMAQRHSGASVLRQDFLKLDLPSDAFDGVFANASLFHVPTQELPRVLAQLWACLHTDGVLFSSNPRGDDQEGYNGQRYGAYHSKASFWRWMEQAGFQELRHYYRPAGLPLEQQPWLASLWKKRA